MGVWTLLNACPHLYLLCIFDNQTKLPWWLTLQMSIPISHLLTMIFYPFSIVHCVLAYVSCVVCGCVSRQFQQAEGLSMGSLQIFDVAKISRNFVDSSGHTPQYVGCVIFLNCANCFVPGPPQPQHIWTPVCRVLGSRPAQPGSACCHPPPNVAKVESDQNVKMAKCVPPYTLQFCTSADCNITDMICYVVVTQLSIQQLLQVQSTAVERIYNLDIKHNLGWSIDISTTLVNICTRVLKIIS